jgi:hypothetical protein
MRYTRRLLQLCLILTLSTGVSCTTGEVGTTEPSVANYEETLRPSSIVGTPDDPLIDVRLLSCTPQDYLINSQVIGPKGGKIKVGNHLLFIPAGALSQSVTIVAEQIPGSTNSVRLSPEGLRFARSAELTLNYQNCLAAPGKKTIVYTNENLQVLELLKSTDKSPTKIVTTGIDHFSRYAVAY